MLVKRYVVDDMPEALAKIRQDLGKDAIILSTKRVRAAGMSGLFGKKRMEVIAAVSDSTNAKEPKPAPQVAGRDSSSTQTNRTAVGQIPVQPTVPAVPAAHAMNQYSKAQTIPFPSSSASHPRTLSAAKPQLQPSDRTSNLTVIPAVSNAVQPELQTAAYPEIHSVVQPEPAAVHPAVHKAVEETSASLLTVENKDLASQKIIQEVREMRKLLLQVTGNADSDIPDQLRKFLLEQDMHKETIEHILHSVQARLDLRQAELDAAKEAAEEVIREEIQNRYTPLGIRASSRFVAFVGPTGVGKTTTIAKIAADHVLRQGHSVALLTTDTYRIAAVEQLRTYANILKVPMQVVFGEEDLKEALAKYANYDLLLLDSAGRNYGNPEFVQDLSRFLSVASPDETYLVLSLTARTSVLNKIVHNFSGVQVDRLLFTKLDETDTAGAIYSLAHEHDKPLSYVTTGQTVPDDIQIYTPERLAKLSLGEKLDV